MDGTKASLSDFEITKRWPAQYPDRIQLYSMTTPNGVKASIMLEETGLPYEAHLVDIGKDESHEPEYRALNPYAKIPAIIDPDGPEGVPLGLFESGAVLFYLAEKSGRFLPATPGRRYETVQWVFFQVGGLGPMAGQLGYFHAMGGKDIADKRPRDHFAAQVKRILGVMEERLTGRDWIMGEDYTIADIALLGWTRAIGEVLKAGELVEWNRLKAVPAWLERGLARPAVQRGLHIPE